MGEKNDMWGLHVREIRVKAMDGKKEGRMQEARHLASIIGF